MEEKKRGHSVPVPRLYKEAAKILRKYENKEGSLKTLVYNAKFPDLKRLYALSSRAVENSKRIKLALAISKVLVEQPRFDPHLAEVLTAELLRKGTIEGQSKPVLTLLQYEDKLKKTLDSSSKEASQQEDKVRIPRYVRVNTIYATIGRVHMELAEAGWKLVGKPVTSYDEFLEAVKNLGEFEYIMDYHIEELLVFPPNTPFWDSPLYKTGAVVLQDKASCLPVFLSSLEPGANVIDACAAPGNKTSYIAAVLKNKGKLLAVEKDQKRFEILEKHTRRYGVGCVRCENKDFTKLSRDKYAAAAYIFVDPSCSNSGEPRVNQEVTPMRVKSLASFQVMLLKFALSFPFVKEVLYSTCSVYEEENENVVSDVLKHFGNQFELEDIGKKLDGWKHLGHDRFSFGSKCVRTVPEVDLCHGFFVAKFVRKDNVENEESEEAESEMPFGNADIAEDESRGDDNSDEAESNSGKHKSKRKERKNPEEDHNGVEEESKPPKRKKKKKSSSNDEVEVDTSEGDVLHIEEVQADVQVEECCDLESSAKKKKKKKGKK